MSEPTISGALPAPAWPPAEASRPAPTSPTGRNVSRFREPGEGASLSISLATVAGLLGLWWWVTTMGWISPLFLPSPPAVWQQLHDYALGQANDHSLWAHLGASLGRVLLAFVLACLTAIPAGIAMGSSRWARGVLDPLLEFYRPLPPLAYLPLIIIWCGINELPKVLLIYLSCFAPLALAARSGMRQASPEQIHAAASLGARHWQLVRHVLLPAALPEILVGMRIALGFGWTTLVAAEMVAASLGLGAQRVAVGLRPATCSLTAPSTCPVSCCKRSMAPSAFSCGPTRASTSTAT